MAELLLELFSEEIPARMQGRAAEDLMGALTDGLKAAGLGHGEAESFVTPRRLTVVIEGLAAKSADVEDERKGPRVGAPEAAVQGFLKAAGLASLAEATVVNDKKGDFYVARIKKPGREAAAIVAELVPAVVAKFAWPKSMRWGNRKMRWVRPLTSVLCLLGGKVVPFGIDGLVSGAVTSGHRFHSKGPIEVKDFADYRKKLAAAKVLIDPAERAAIIGGEARKLAAQYKLELIEDEALLNENAGLTEWPVVMMGSFDEAFLVVPGEVLTTSMKAHQKCFSLRDPKTKKLANKFLLVANLEAEDGGATIVGGNEKVIRARLSDAKFFWEGDLKRKLEPMHFELKGITFHQKLGSQWERMERITELARDIAPLVKAEPDLAGRAAQLCKADLVSGVVGEFPELQGLIGRYLAEAEHINPKIAHALEQHYWPRGQGDGVPNEPVAIAVALADKLDTLVGFWKINERPTGSKDPFALRRAALGVVRIILENELRVPLGDLAQDHLERVRPDKRSGWAADATGLPIHRLRGRLLSSSVVDLIGFFADRLQVQLREQGARHDLVEAVMGPGIQDDLLMIVRRVEALSAFLATDDGKNLLAGAKRAANILRIEEKKDKTTFEDAIDAKKLELPEEKALAKAISEATDAASKAIASEDFSAAMTAIARLRAPVDAFFDKVTVNADEPSLRKNRLNLLAQIRAATRAVADFSKIEG